MAAQTGMGVKVRFHRGAWWVFINHRGMRKSKRIGDKETALTVARAIRERLASGDLQLGATDAETLSTYADGWKKGLSGLKASTVRFYGAPSIAPTVAPSSRRFAPRG